MSNSPLLGNGKPVLMLAVPLCILLHGGAGVGHKRLLHGLANPQTQKFVRLLPLLGHHEDWNTEIKAHPKSPPQKLNKGKNIYHNIKNLQLKFVMQNWLIHDQVWMAVYKMWCNNASIISQPAYEGHEAHYLKK